MNLIIPEIGISVVRFRCRSTGWNPVFEHNLMRVVLAESGDETLIKGISNPKIMGNIYSEHTS